MEAKTLKYIFFWLGYMAGVFVGGLPSKEGTLDWKIRDAKETLETAKQTEKYK